MTLLNQKGLLCLAILFSFIGEVKAQYLSQIEIRDSIYSEVLNESREFYVKLPAGYDPDSDKKYPTAYLLDGDVLLSALSITHDYYYGGFIPEMILIGISNSQNRDRDLTPSVVEPSYVQNGGASEFSKFISQELIPTIEKEYSVNDYRTLIGHSFGGLFTVNTLIHQPELFENYLAIDPSLDWDDQLMLRQAQEIFTEGSLKGKSLYISLSGQLHMQKPEMNLTNVMQDDSEFTLFARSNISFSEFMGSKSGQGISFHWEFFPKDLHGTIPLPSFRNGLISLFEWFQMEKVELFNIPETPSEVLLDLMNYRAKKLESRFGYFVPPYPEDLMNVSGYMSMENGEMKRAKMFFEQGILYYPNSANMYDSMADYYEASEDVKSALEFVKKAYEISGSEYHKNRIEELEQKVK